MLVCELDDDGGEDECDESLRQVIPTHQGNIVESAAPQATEALPSSGGFGTHMIDCGG